MITQAELRELVDELSVKHPRLTGLIVLTETGPSDDVTIQVDFLTQYSRKALNDIFTRYIIEEHEDGY